MSRLNGRELNHKWDVGARHALYRESGDWYHVPRQFPAALFDAHGYVRFESEGDLEIDGIWTSKEDGKNWLAVRKPGISSLDNYVRMDIGRQQEKPAVDPNDTEGVPLREYDESELIAVQESRTVKYRRRHRRITNALCERFAALKPKQGQRLKNEYDVLLTNYDRTGRDLLIEVKPYPDIDSLRIAIGQLYDYRRFLRNAAATDLAVLTIGKPTQSYLDLLSDLGITSLWFKTENCGTLQGAGTAWKSLH